MHGPACELRRSSGRAELIGVDVGLLGDEAVHIALDTMAQTLYDNTGGATYYYAHNIVYPSWAKKFIVTEVIGNHTFMKPN